MHRTALPMQDGLLSFFSAFFQFEACRGFEFGLFFVECARQGPMQLISKLGALLHVNEMSLAAWKRYADCPDGVCALVGRFFGCRSKGVLLKIAHGGSVPEWHDPKVREFLTAMSTESMLLRWLSRSAIPRVHEHVLDEKDLVI